MSTGITYNLPASAEWVLMALMLTGRIGTITQMTSASETGLKEQPALPVPPILDVEQLPLTSPWPPEGYGKERRPAA